MPAVSKKQRRFMGADLARLEAGKKTKTGMSKSQLSDFASGREKGLPTRITRDGVKKRLKKK